MYQIQVYIMLLSLSHYNQVTGPDPDEDGKKRKERKEEEAALKKAVQEGKTYDFLSKLLLCVKYILISDGSRIFPWGFRRGRFTAKTFVKMEELGPVERVHAGSAPLIRQC